MISSDIVKQAWFSNLESVHQRAVVSTLDLLEREKKLQGDFSDYSFILFPIAKAYEGFLKKLLFDLHLIDEHVYFGKKFRIGRALNPDIHQNQRDEWWLYDDLTRFCGEALARKIWNAWVSCRNHVFHFFPSEHNEFSLQQIESKTLQLIEVFELATQCELTQKKR